MRNLSRTENSLITLGHRGLLQSLLASPLPFTVELRFQSLATAKRTQKLLYDWLFFYPTVKARVSLRLETEPEVKLILTPKGLPEKRGRKKIGELR